MSRIGEGSRAATRNSSRERNPSLSGKVRDIEHRKSLGNHEFLHEHAAIGDRVVHGESGHGTIEEILAGLHACGGFRQRHKSSKAMRLRTTPFSASRREMVRCDAPRGISTYTPSLANP